LYDGVEIASSHQAVWVFQQIV